MEALGRLFDEPIMQLPEDLYIPPEALRVFLEAFEGPLDLLLYLIRRQNLDILTINVATITHQYIEYVELMKAMEIELAGEYLLMAAMLAEIKSPDAAATPSQSGRRGGRGSPRRADSPPAGVRAAQEAAEGWIRCPASAGTGSVRAGGLTAAGNAGDPSRCRA